jgi:hypothetical protein
VEEPFVETFAPSDRRQVRVVGVVRDEDEAGLGRLAVDRDPERVTMRHDDCPGTKPRECLATPPMAFAAVHEPRVETERHVVQEQATVRPPDVDPALEPAERGEGSHGVFGAQAEISREVIPCAEGHADEREVSLERHLGDRPEGSVAACNAQDVGRRRPRDLFCAFSLVEDAHLEPEGARLASQVLRAGAAGATGSGVDQEKTGQAREPKDGTYGEKNEPFGPCAVRCLCRSFEGMSERGLHRIEDDLSDSWIEDWAGAGVAEIEALLAKHAAFLTFLESQEA